MPVALRARSGRKNAQPAHGAVALAWRSVAGRRTVCTLMNNLVNSIRPSVTEALAALPWVLGTLLGLSGCGGQPEVAKQPEPVQVVWSRADGTEAPDDAPTEASDAPRTNSKEIDLDALPVEKKPAHKEKEKEKEKAQEEPAAPSAPPPAAPEAEIEAEAEAPAPEPPPVAEPAAPVPLGKEIRAAVKAKDRDPPPAKKSAAKKKAPATPSDAVAAYTGPSPCKAARFSVPRVKEACATGGRNAAKGVMKDAVGKALAAGATLKCGDCHAEQKNYTLKEDAVAQLKKWLGP
jgi:hypothetical protein